MSLVVLGTVVSDLGGCSSHLAEAIRSSNYGFIFFRMGQSCLPILQRLDRSREERVRSLELFLLRIAEALARFYDVIVLVRQESDLPEMG